jgi:hypothetical protein
VFTATALRWLVDRRPKADDAADRRGNCSADQRRTPTCTEPNDTGCYRVRMETCRSRSAIRHGAGHHGGLDDAEPSHGNHLIPAEFVGLSDIGRGGLLLRRPIRDASSRM